MVKAAVISDAATANAGEHTPNENSVTSGQTDFSFALWSREHFKVGFWEATPGVSRAFRRNERFPARLGPTRVWSVTRLDPAAVPERRPGRTLYEDTAR